MLTIDQISDDAPFPFPSTWEERLIVRAHFYPPHIESESQNNVLTECFMFFRVAKVHLFGSFGIFDLCRPSNAML